MDVGNYIQVYGSVFSMCNSLATYDKEEIALTAAGLTE